MGAGSSTAKETEPKKTTVNTGMARYEKKALWGGAKKTSAKKKTSGKKKTSKK